MEKIFHANGNQKRAGVAIKFQNGFESKKLARDKRHYILVKVSIQQEDVIIINICIHNRRAPKYVKQKFSELKISLDSFIVIVGEFNILLSIMDRTTR